MKPLGIAPPGRVLIKVMLFWTDSDVGIERLSGGRVIALLAPPFPVLTIAVRGGSWARHKVRLCG